MESLIAFGGYRDIGFILNDKLIHIILIYTNLQNFLASERAWLLAPSLLSFLASRAGISVSMMLNRAGAPAVAAAMCSSGAQTGIDLIF